MKRIIISSILLVSAALVGCDKDMTAVEEPTTGLEVKIADLNSTKTTENLSTESSLYLSLDYDDNTYDQEGIEWTYSNGVWTPERTMLWRDKSTCPILKAYSPADGDYSEIVSFSAKFDQSSYENFTASELYGYTGQVDGDNIMRFVEDGILLTLGRKMAMLEFTFADTDLNIINVKVSGVHRNIIYTVSTATADIDPQNDVRSNNCVAYNDNGTYKLIIAPQTLLYNSFVVEATTLTGNTLTYTFGSNITLTSGEATPITLSESI